MKPTSLELCAGAGGQALGLEQAGFSHVGLVENDKFPCDSLRKNRPKWNVIQQDLREFDAKPYSGVDLLAGGLPCPPFSLAGKGLGIDDERNLFPELFRIIGECEPKAVLVENVRGMLQPKFEVYFSELLAEFDKLGFTVDYKVLNAADFGVPQLRPRLVLVALNRMSFNAFNWPKPRKTAPTVGECLGDMMASNGWKRVKRWKKIANTIAPTLVGGSKKHGGPDLGPTRAKEAWEKLGVNGHTVAVEAPERDFDGMPRLTTRMAAALQGFPDTWEFVGAKTNAYRQVGNAFPPPVAKAVGSKIRQALESVSNTNESSKKARRIDVGGGSPRQNRQRRYSFVDLFCGAGGMTKGFVDTGLFKPKYAVESIEAFANTYSANFGCHVDNRDIREVVNDVSARKVKSELVIGGPPCQGFSNLGPNKADDPRREFWRYFMDVVEMSECKVFLIENVPNLLTSDEGAEIIETAQGMGFHVSSGLLMASDFGVPQNRKRAFIIGSRRGLIKLPAGSGDRSTVRMAFKGIPRKPNVHDFQQNGPIPTSRLHIARNPTELSLKRYALIPPGGNRFDLQRLAPELTPECWIRKTKGGTDLYGRLEWNGPARCTIRTEFYKPEKGRFLHPTEDRPITHWEAARLQTFPDNFLWCGSKIQIAIQIGNAVPPLLAKVLAECIADHFRTPKRQLASS